MLMSLIQIEKLKSYYEYHTAKLKAKKFAKKEKEFLRETNFSRIDLEQVKDGTRAI